MYIYIYVYIYVYICKYICIYIYMYIYIYIYVYIYVYIYIYISNIYIYTIYNTTLRRLFPGNFNNYVMSNNNIRWGLYQFYCEKNYITT